MITSYQTSAGLQKLADRIRFSSIKSMYASKGGHVGGVLSLCELMAVLYGSIMATEVLRGVSERCDRATRRS